MALLPLPSPISCIVLKHSIRSCLPPPLATKPLVKTLNEESPQRITIPNTVAIQGVPLGFRYTGQVKLCIRYQDIKYFKHRSAGSVREMFLLIGSVLKAQVVGEISRAKCFGILSDEVCDVSNKEQLVTFVKFVHPDTGEANTAFLAASDVLEESTTGSADAKSIADAILKQVDDSGINRNKLASFSSYGASVMMGKRNGVAARLRADNKALR